MRLVFLPFILIALFVVYVIVLIVLKKDKQYIREVITAGLFFTCVWAGIYYFLLR